MGRKRTGGKMGRPRKNDYDKLAELYGKGMSLAAVARMVGIHHTTAKYALDKMGFDTSIEAKMARHKSISAMRRAEALAEREARDIRDREICRMYQEEGLSPTQLSARTGLPTSTVFGIVKRHGVRRKAAYKVGVQDCRDYQKAREEFLKAAKQAHNARVERMCELAERIAKRNLRMTA